MGTDNVTARLANLDARYSELVVKVSALADRQETEHQRLLRLEQSISQFVERAAPSLFGRIFRKAVR